MQTYSKEEARDLISRLVESFQKVEATLGEAQESQIENDYIRPLFRYLNWRTESAGLRMSEREMVLVETDRQGKRPDYRFQLNGQHLFFVDAKKVKYRMHDPRWQWQVYRYAYSTRNNPAPRKVDFGVLTDFQEFILLDCTFEARKPEAVNNFRVLDWRYADYVTQFDRLWDIFERNNVLAASGDRKSGLWACYLSPKQAKANRVAPDEGFLDKLDNDKNGWRVRLAKDMKKCSPNLTGEVITAAVQLLIDRLVFIKALSDRDIDDDYLAKLAECIETNGLGEDDRGWFSAAKPVFDRLNRFYDGSIFKSQTEETVITSNRVVRDIIRELDPDNSPYDLSVLPVEILGTIYERFLGKVVRTTEQRVKIEDKPEVRKAGGVYYTPQYIVHYIVEQTVGKLLAVCKTPDDVAKLKILDPACGSGSFLLGAYDALIEWHKSYYAAKAKPAREAAYRDADGDIRLTARLKRQILLNNLFGVDIDQQAVEVTRFSLSLKALEDTRKDELDEERNLFNETVLPDLKDNIVCGNSLIGTDILEGQLFEPIEERKLNPMNYKDKFPEIMGRGGFDAVIGNPPYVRQETLGPMFKDYAQIHFTSFASTADLYTYFIERAHNILKPGGLFSYIVSNKFMRANYGRPLRNFLASKTTLLQVIDFGELPVFENAATFPAILVTRNSPAMKQNFTHAAIKRLNFDSLTEEVKNIGKQLDESALAGDSWTLAAPAMLAVFQKIKAKGITLGEYVDGQIYYGIKTGFDNAFVIDAVTRRKLIAEDPNSAKVLKQYGIGDDVRNYKIHDGQRWLIFFPRGWTNQNKPPKTNAWVWISNEFPAIAKHLEPFAKDASKRCDQGDYWWELRACAYYDAFEQPKLVWPEIAKEPRFAYDADSLFLNKTCFICPVDDKYLLALLNSKVIWFFLKNTCSVLGDADKGGRLLQQKIYLERVPIRKLDLTDKADKARHDKLVGLVEQMLTAKKAWAAAQTEKDKTYYDDKCKALDKQIDALVYELYGLTAEEIAIVEKTRC